MVMDAIRNRRSVRAFEKRPVEPEKIELLLEAALRAPSSRGKRPWELVVLLDPAVLERLARAKPHGSSFLASAPLGIAVLGRADESDVWVEDCSIACAFIQLAAEALGLGSCWIQIRRRNHSPDLAAGAYAASALGFSPGFEVEAIIAAGYPAEKPAAYQRSELPWSQVHLNRRGTRFFPR